MTYALSFLSFFQNHHHHHHQCILKTGLKRRLGSKETKKHALCFLDQQFKMFYVKYKLTPLLVEN